MKLQVKVKLNLSKITKTVVVKYNTFEKATFDEYLIASLALRSKNEKEAYDYIDDLTGQGSLNEYFRSIYEELKILDDRQLGNIINNSLYPILKIDKNNWYYYYPQLNVSEYRKTIYAGDLGERADVLQIIKLTNVDIVEKSVEEKQPFDRPDIYNVELLENDIFIRLYEQKAKITEEIFNEIRINDLTKLNNYTGTISPVTEGNWNILTDSAIDGMLKYPLHAYIDGKLYQIRRDNCKVTTVSVVSGLYIYKEDITKYQGNRELSKILCDVIVKSDLYAGLDEQTALSIIRNVDDETAQILINKMLSRSDFKELCQYGLRLLSKGLEKGWNINAQFSFVKRATGLELVHLYKEYPELDYSMEQLLQLDKSILTRNHLARVELYINNLNAKKETIRKIIGEVTTSGLRERVKNLPKDSDTQQFSKKCNELIGHVKDDLALADMRKTDIWLSEATELKKLMDKINRKFSEEK